MINKGILIFFVVLGCLISICVCGRHELIDYDPVALNGSSVIVDSVVRFSVLSDRLLRIEYNSKGDFEDGQTIAILNRKMKEVPYYSHNTSNDGIFNLKTNKLSVSWKIGDNLDSLLIKGIGDGKRDFKGTYKYGTSQSDSGNLFGTIKSLDAVGRVPLDCNYWKGKQVHNESVHCEWGLISRSGWAIYDDSDDWSLTSDDWWDSLNKNDFDLYFFGHGLNFLDAIREYGMLGGKVAMVPRYAMGIFWSIWQNLDSDDVLDILNDYSSRNIPLDVYVLDMDWHTKQGWGGYTFDQRLFPIPSLALQSIKKAGVAAVAANVHDCDGVRPNEKMFPEMCAAMGFNPATHGTIPLSIVNATYMYSLDDIVLKNVEDQGMDFWWMDWQQGGKVGGCAGGKQNPTIWLNHIRGTDHLRRGEPKRGLILSRFGGMGSHRYQIGFSGDVEGVTWNNLAFQPYFSATSANVLFGYWSHDIVGPPGDSPEMERQELFTRWVQWGAYSGAFRTHDRGMSAGSCANDNTCGFVRVWKSPSANFEINRAAMQARSRLIPYIYTAFRSTFDFATSLISPLYHYFPETDGAYLLDPNGTFPQYMFGPSILVSPVVMARDSKTLLASKDIWLPPGDWVSLVSGSLFSNPASGLSVKQAYDLSEIPAFVQGGSILPEMEVPSPDGKVLGLASIPQPDPLVFRLFPVKGSNGSFSVYEDDSVTTSYLSGEFFWTNLTYTYNGDRLSLFLSTSGSFEGMRSHRSYKFLLVNCLPLSSGSINGKKLNYSLSGEPLTWRYDGTELTLIVNTGSISTSSSLKADFTFISGKNQTFLESHLPGVKGMISRCSIAKKNFDSARVTPGSSSVNGGYLSLCAIAGKTLTYLADQKDDFVKRLLSFPEAFQDAINEVAGMEPPPETGALVQLWDESRSDNCLCGTTKCISDNSFYQQLRIEGYQPPQGTPNTTPLNDWWDESITDNYATTKKTRPVHYTPAEFDNGVVYVVGGAGRRPLSVYWSDSRNDMLTVSSDEGIEYAKKNGYTLINDTIGFVLEKPVYQSIGVNHNRWEYSMALLKTAM